ncbi:Hypothetical predicted protein, partial [Marmota monax]
VENKPLAQVQKPPSKIKNLKMTRHLHKIGSVGYKHQYYFTPFYGYQGEEECDQPPTHQQQNSAEAWCAVP